jgi:uncharacterized membrane protein
MSILPILIIAVLGIGAIIFFVINDAKYNINVIIRDKTKNSSIVKKDRAKEFIDAANIKMLKFKREKANVPLPPDYCYDVDNKGKRFIEFIKESDLSYIPLKYDVKSIDINASRKHAEFQRDEMEARISVYNEWKKGTSMQEVGLLHALKEFAPYLALIIVVFVGYLMYDSVGKHVVEVAQVQAEITDKQVQMMDNLNQFAAFTLEKLPSNSTTVRMGAPR